MRYLKDREESEAIIWMKEAAKVAEKALCLRNDHLYIVYNDYAD